MPRLVCTASLRKREAKLDAFGKELLIAQPDQPQKAGGKEVWEGKEPWVKRAAERLDLAGRIGDAVLVLADMEQKPRHRDILLKPNNPEVVEKDKSDIPDAVPKRVQVGSSPIYNADRRLGKGGFGQVFLGRRAFARRTHNDPEGAGAQQVAIKFEHKSSKGCNNGPPHEWSVYSQLGDTYGVPKVYHRGQQNNFYIMVMDLLGPSLWDVWNLSGNRLSDAYVACVAIEALFILQSLHEKGFVHGDVKPENFLLGPPNGARSKKLYLVDMGLATKFREKGSHVKYDQRPDDFRGTIRYASVHAHLGRTMSRRDDLESLAYTLLFLLKGRLPWQGYQGENKGYWVCKRKMGMSPEQLCRLCHPIFCEFTAAALALRFDEQPEYAKLIAMFEPLVTAVEPPLSIQTALQVGRKRARSDADGSSEGAGQPKRQRLGAPASQWVTVYNKRDAIKQRYHYNVTSDRLVVHVEKGWADGLYISSVAACNNTWAVVLDASISFTKQIYMVHARSFLPREWIMEKWEEGFYITALAGTDDGTSLVVMSKGSRFTQQSYKVGDSFPFEWIKKKWREGYHVTAMATSLSSWGVVMSKNSGYEEQCVELDFQYPSEGIHQRWDAGYRITCCAATYEQCAFILSAPRKRAWDETQETLRTSTFPVQHVKEKWDKGLFISGIAYGRTVS